MRRYFLLVAFLLGLFASPELAAKRIKKKYGRSFKKTSKHKTKKAFKKLKVAAPKLTTVVIDAGHGGKDIGARGLQSTEKAITLGVALKLYKKLKDNYPEIKFVMTRTSDVFDNVRTKANKANNAKGDLFICIHVNSAGRKPGGWYEKKIIGYEDYKVTIGKGKKKKTITKTRPIYEEIYVKNEAHGTETYIWAADRTDSKESFIGKRYISKYDTLGLSNEFSSQEKKIEASLKAKKYFKKSYQLATYIEEEYAKVGRNSRGIKQRNDEGIWVLQATGMPSILTEIGFNSNAEEEAYLVSNDGQNQIVDCIANAFSRYKLDIDAINTNANSLGYRKKKLMSTANNVQP
jgi:N-acetylmuramoyl-L-alanine amidase